MKLSHAALSFLMSLALSAAPALALDETATPAPAKKPAPVARKTPAKADAKPATDTGGAVKPRPPADEWVKLETSVGDVVIDLFEKETPGHAENFKKLVRQGYYDGSPFHRVIPGFMAQGGGQWGPSGQPIDVGYKQPAEIHPELHHERGTVAAARLPDQVNPNKESSGSQFYICFGSTPHLDGEYTIFGKVVQGMDVVDKIQPGAPGSGSVDKATATLIKHASLIPAGTTAAPQPATN